jgi:very-long-chain enoyl-CoA reductase
MRLTATFKGKQATVEIEPTATVRNLKHEFQRAFKRSPTAVLACSSNCASLKLYRRGSSPADGRRAEVVRLADPEMPVSDVSALLAAEAQDTLYFSDVGAQISYRFVFFFEYFGPIAIMLLFALRPAFAYGRLAGANREWAPTAKLGVALWTLHFVKRELETFFVHRFSRETMPLSNLAKNSLYYWSFALFVAYVLCHPLYTPPEQAVGVRTQAAVACWILCQIANLAVHLQFARARPRGDGSQARPYPKGMLFALVSCPNYTAEVGGWLCFSVMTGVLASYAFTLVGLGQMTAWAKKKHRAYHRAHEGYKALGRKAIIPFLV